MTIKHRFQTGRADNGDAGAVQPSHWNDTHVLAGLLALIDAVAPQPNTVFSLDGSSNPLLIPVSTLATPASVATQITTAINALVAGAPGALNTLKELADAINDDASFAATITAALGLKAPLASPALTGAPTAPTPTLGDNTTKIATTAFVLANVLGSFNSRTGAVIPRADDYAAFGGLELFNLGFTVSASGGALTINLTDATGATPSVASPVVVPFRGPLATGTTSVLKVTAATSIVVPSTSTLGTTSAVACRLWIVGFNDGGTFRLGVFNASDATGIYALNEAGVASSLQVVAAGNAAGQFYTAGAAVASKAFRILGYVDWTSSGIVTAGTWTTTNLNSIQIFGPGLKKPGDIVQSTFFLQGTGSTTTSTSLVDVTGATRSITPTSAANGIRVSAQASCSVAADGSGINTSYQSSLLRGGAALSSFSIGAGSGGGANLTSNGNGSWMAFDLPNSAVSVTYKLQHSTLNAAGAASTAGVNMLVEEVMR
jgi:hypothetical protein